MPIRIPERLSGFNPASSPLYCRRMNAVSESAPDALLVTANARYSHTSLALRSLLANLGELANRSALAEFTIEEKPSDIVEKILMKNPRTVCLGVYIWNALVLAETARILKQIRPDIPIIAGGPEVSFESPAHPVWDHVDYIVSGEGETALPRLLAAILDGRPPDTKLIVADPPDVTRLRLPYDLYSEEDIRHRVVYVEASRGCPFTCAFCLSALDKKVRRFPEQPFLDALETLYARGARRFKFIDRALHLAVTPKLLDFFLEKGDPGLFVHFELVPDRLPPTLLDRLKRFPRGAVQVEAGIQTLDDDVARRIGRKQDLEKALQTLETLRKETGIHIHSDLVVGLPGESLSTFEQGFNRLFALGLHEIQVGILKKLPGAPIAAFDRPFGMVYNRQPPYDILKNNLIDFATMQRLKRFAKYFDLVCNRGHFISFVPLLIGAAPPFERLLALSDWLYLRTGRTHAIALNRLAELLFEYVVEVNGVPRSDAANRLFADFKGAGRRSFPGSVDLYVTDRHPAPPAPSSAAPLPTRQQRHLRSD